MSSNHIERIAVIGAGGQSGGHITNALLATKRFQVTAISRPDSTSALPAGLANVIKVSYDDTDALTKALKGIQVLIITLSVTAPRDSSAKLISAACAAGVPWVLPNEWGVDHLDPSVAKETLIGEPIRANREQIKSEGKGKTNYIAFVNGFWYEYSLAAGPCTFGFDWKNKRVTFFDRGETVMNTTTLPKMGRGVAKLLSLPISKEADGGLCLDDFKNGTCYVSSFRVSQKDMLGSVRRVYGHEGEDWTVEYEDVKERYGKAMGKLREGEQRGFVQAMYTRMFYPEAPGDFEGQGKSHNKALGLEDDDLDEWTRHAKRRFEQQGQFFDSKC